jgi:phage repressor protein C with HTH and peptisase S24 domain
MITPDDIRAELKRLGRSQKDLGEAINLDVYKLSRSMNGARRFQLSEIQAIGTTLQMWDRMEGGNAPRPEQSLRTLEPLYGAPANDTDYVDISKAMMLEMTPIHPAQKLRKGAFAIRLAQDKMRPRYRAGEIVYIEAIAPTRDDYACVTTKDDRAIIGLYEKQENGFIFVRFHNPDIEIRIPANEVENIYRIVGSSS